MHEKSAVVKFREGIHGHLAPNLAEEAKRYRGCKVYIAKNGGGFVEAKSLMLLLSLGVGQGDTVTFKSESKEAVNQLAKFVEQYR